jgi:hypothetical protein
MSSPLNRRAFVASSALAGAGAAFSLNALSTPAQAADKAKPAAKPAPAAAQGPLPMGKLGDLQISRLLLGGNLLTFATHSRDLRYVGNLARHYNTPEKILETLAVAEQHGINTLVIHNIKATMEILKEHRKRGGKMQWITCTAHALLKGIDEYTRQIDELVEHGADALYISGVEADNICGYQNRIFAPDAEQRNGKLQMDVLKRALAVAKATGLQVGIGAHRAGVIADCEKEKLPADFYVKTFHHNKYPSADLNFDSRWCADAEALAAMMRTVEKPWIAFKVMAAGAIPPQNAFKYAFDSGADFVLAGMFDYEVAEDVAIAKNVLAGVKSRPRPWRA